MVTVRQCSEHIAQFHLVESDARAKRADARRNLYGWISGARIKAHIRQSLSLAVVVVVVRLVRRDDRAAKLNAYFIAIIIYRNIPYIERYAICFHIYIMYTICIRMRVRQQLLGNVVPHSAQRNGAPKRCATERLVPRLTNTHICTHIPNS